jgi:hypothetical protein
MKKIKKWFKAIFETKTHIDKHRESKNTDNKLPPQEYQERLALLRNSSDYGSPFGRFQELPTEYFRRLE